MHKFFTGIFLLFLSPAAIVSAQPKAYANSNGNETIEWNEYYYLQWDDFKGKPDPHAAGDAATAVQIKAKPFLVSTEVHYDVYVLFDKNKSWARARSEELLAHEQLHFDLAELYARKIRKKISELNVDKITNVKKYNQAIQQILTESNEADRLYDIETLHGALQKKQAEWAKKIKHELALLKDFKKQRRYIRS